MGDGINRNINMDRVNYDAKVPKPPKKSIIGRILSWPFRAILAILGIDWDEVKAGTVPHYQGPSTTTTTSQSSNQSFRDSHRVEHSPLSPQGFDPVQAANLKMYLGAFDGKGDDDHCH